jgi:MiaB/RimO family radical SAM methylthiotransferase
MATVWRYTLQHGGAARARWLPRLLPARPAAASLIRCHSSRGVVEANRPSRLPDERTLKDFMAKSREDHLAGASPAASGVDTYVAPAPCADEDVGLQASAAEARPPRVYIETYGCQMNESDTEILLSILSSAGYQRTADIDAADVLLANTCAIREGAEDKVWQRLHVFKALRRKRSRHEPRPVVGILGCMAERLKSKLLEGEGRLVDIVAGPDAYRDLPRLINMVRAGEAGVAINVQLSQDETYADVKPVREHGNNVSAFVSIMRGCNNMCSFCVVPFTRGRERSRSVATIVDEVRALAAEGRREVTLLGQNVNSYHDTTAAAGTVYAGRGYSPADGFSNMYRLRGGDGVRFTELLDRVSAAAPEMRVRFTSPHPKDFPDDLLALMAERPNICKQVHMPAQSGSSDVLASMRRGYSREAYLALATRIRAAVPGVALSSDFISGFCGETAAQHQETISLMRAVRYEQAFMFAYSLRERTHAAHKLSDDVPEAVKLARLQEVIATFREVAAADNQAEVGRVHLVLVEGESKRSTAAAPEWTGRSDTNKRVVVAAPPAGVLPPSLGVALAEATGAAERWCGIQPGQYIAVRVVRAGVTTLSAVPLAVTTLSEFAALAPAVAAREALGTGASPRMAAANLRVDAMA